MSQHDHLAREPSSTWRSLDRGGPLQLRIEGGDENRGPAEAADVGALSVIGRFLLGASEAGVAGLADSV